MSLIGAYRYLLEKRAILAGTRLHGEQSCKLMSDLATPLLLTSDFGGLNAGAGTRASISRSACKR